jgi:hypothetical protein
LPLPQLHTWHDRCDHGGSRTVREAEDNGGEEEEPGDGGSKKKAAATMVVPPGRDAPNLGDAHHVFTHKVRNLSK